MNKPKLEPAYASYLQHAQLREDGLDWHAGVLLHLLNVRGNLKDGLYMLTSRLSGGGVSVTVWDEGRRYYRADFDRWMQVDSRWKRSREVGQKWIACKVIADLRERGLMGDYVHMIERRDQWS